MGINAQDDKDLNEISIAKNHNDSGSTTNAQDDEDIKEVETAKGTMHVQSEGLTKPKDDGKELDFEHKEGCPCRKESNPGQGGVRGMGAGNTSQQGSGESAQISEEKKEDTGVSAETLGNPDRLKKPGNITQDRPSSMKCSKCNKCKKCGKTKTI